MPVAALASRLLDFVTLENRAAILRLAWEAGWPEPKPGQYLRLDVGEKAVDLFILRRGSSELSLYCPESQTEGVAKLVAETKWVVSEPLGIPCRLDTGKRHRLLLADDIGFPALMFLAQQLSQLKPKPSILALLAFQQPPFSPRPSQFVLPGMPPGVIAALPLLEDWGVASRLVCADFAPGCYFGDMADLLSGWLGDNDLSVTEVGASLFGCTEFVRPLIEVLGRHGVENQMVIR